MTSEEYWAIVAKSRAMEMCVEYIDNALTVESERPTGEWIVDRDGFWEDIIETYLKERGVIKNDISNN